MKPCFAMCFSGLTIIFNLLTHDRISLGFFPTKVDISKKGHANHIRIFNKFNILTLPIT